jgi:hypothetical protein
MLTKSTVYTQMNDAPLKVGCFIYIYADQTRCMVLTWQIFLCSLQGFQFSCGSCAQAASATSAWLLLRTGSLHRSTTCRLSAISRQRQRVDATTDSSKRKNRCTASTAAPEARTATNTRKKIFQSLHFQFVILSLSPGISNFLLRTLIGLKGSSKGARGQILSS